MSPTPTPAAAPELPAVSELLEQRAQVQGWLARLDECSSDVNDRVAARVRGDYQRRLQNLLDTLASRRDALLDECNKLGEQLSALESRLEEATDALEEARLRHRIGELPENEWAARRPGLEAELDAARSERDSARAELDRLSEILASIDGADDTPIQSEPLAAADGEATDPEVTLSEPAPRADTWMEADHTLPEPGPSARDEAQLLDDATEETGHPSFLEELDRAIGSSPELDEFDPEKRPPAGVKCSDCGYTNDLEAWYCGVCGADLA